MNIPLLADKTHDISRRYGVLKEDEGVAFRGLFIIDDKQNLRQITVNDLPVGRSVDETLRLVQAFQFTGKLIHQLIKTITIIIIIKYYNF
jgi:peroxiredoxin 1